MFLLRHGQSEFNLHFTRTKRDPGIEDPRLTQAGLDQARAAGRALAPRGIARIIVSPYTRALQTAQVAAAELPGDPPTNVQPLVRERYAFTCDIGTAGSSLRANWPQHDMATLEETWWPGGIEPEATVVARAAMFRDAMRAQPDQARTLLVSHWGFLLCLTGRSIANGEWIEWDPADAAPGRIDWSH